MIIISIIIISIIARLSPYVITAYLEITERAAYRVGHHVLFDMARR